MTTFAGTSASSHRCHASMCFRIGSKLRCMRSTPTEVQSIKENDFECLASTGVNTPGTMFPNPREIETHGKLALAGANESQSHTRRIQESRFNLDCSDRRV